MLSGNPSLGFYILFCPSRESPLFVLEILFCAFRKSSDLLVLEIISCPFKETACGYGDSNGAFRDCVSSFKDCDVVFGSLGDVIS